MTETEKKEVLSESEAVNLGAKMYEEMDKETQDLITDVMFATIDVINSYRPETQNAIYEEVAYRLLREEVIGRMKHNELWNVKDKCWIISKLSQSTKNDLEK